MTNWYWLALAIATGCQHAPQNDPPPTVGALATNSVRWIGTSVVVCGQALASDLPEYKLVITAMSGSTMRGVFVDLGARTWVANDGQTCASGVFRRADGRTRADINRQGYVVGVADGFDSDYAIYPPAAVPARSERRRSHR